MRCCLQGRQVGRCGTQQVVTALMLAQVQSIAEGWQGSARPSTAASCNSAWDMAGCRAAHSNTPAGLVNFCGKAGPAAAVRAPQCYFW